MADYPFKINITTKDGAKKSFFTASLATNVDTIVSASAMVDRVNNMFSASSFIESIEAPSLTSTKYNNTSEGIKFLSASVTHPNTGSIIFTDTEDTALGGLDHYEFYGTKVCSVLGLPEGVPIYTENFKLSDSSTDTTNYISGEFISDRIALKKGFKMSPQARVQSNLVWDHAFGEGFLQWVSGSTTKQFMGYDPVKDLYNIGTSQITASSATFGATRVTTLTTSGMELGVSNFLINNNGASTNVQFRGPGPTIPVQITMNNNSALDGIQFNSANLYLNNNKIFFDSNLGAGHTYIQESSNDILDFYVGGDNMLKIDEGNNAITMPQQPCFHVHKSTAQTPGVSTTDTQVTFDTERTDAGGNFASNTFTAPVDGTYLFQATLDVRTIPSTTDYLWCKIVTSNETYFGDIFRIDDFANSEVDYFSFSCTAIADMDASDTAIVKIQSANAGTGWKVHGVSGQPHSFFQGYLIG